MNINIEDNTQQIVTDAQVMVGSQIKQVDVNGQVTYNLTSATYNYKVTSPSKGVKVGQIELSSDTTITIVLGVTNILTNNYKLNFYPNPSTSILNIELSKPAEGATMIITDVKGRAIMQRPITSTHEQIDMSQLPKGVYLINIKIDGQNLQNKVILR